GRKRQRADLPLLSEVWFHRLLDKRGLSRPRRRRHRHLGRSQLSGAHDLGVGSVASPLGVPAVRSAAEARGKAGVRAFCPRLPLSASGPVERELSWPRANHCDVGPREASWSYSSSARASTIAERWALASAPVRPRS